MRLIEESGIPTAALAGAIEESALHQYALEQGYSVTPQEIAEEVERERQLVDELEQKLAPARAFIEVVGEDRYWSEIYPVQAERKLLLKRLGSDLIADSNSNEEHRERWAKVRMEAVQGVEIVIVDHDAVEGATVEEALDFLEQRWTNLPD